MIKEEKLKIIEKMKILKKNNNYFRRQCEGTPTTSKETNTIEILRPESDRTFINTSTQIEPYDESCFEEAKKETEVRINN